MSHDLNSTPIPKTLSKGSSFFSILINPSYTTVNAVCIFIVSPGIGHLIEKKITKVTQSKLKIVDMTCQRKTTCG